MKGAARYEWSHSVPIKSTTTLPTGEIIDRKQRMIVTYRRLGDGVIRLPNE
jgi:hypothetical protein